MLTKRRRFIKTIESVGIGALVPIPLLADEKDIQPFEWICGNLMFSVDVQDGKLRQKRLLVSGNPSQQDNSSGVEVAKMQRGKLSRCRHEIGHRPAWRSIVVRGLSRRVRGHRQAADLHAHRLALEPESGFFPRGLRRGSCGPAAFTNHE